MPSQSFRPSFHNPVNIRLRVKTIELLTMQFSPASNYFVPLCPSILISPLLPNTELVSFPRVLTAVSMKYTDVPQARADPIRMPSADREF
jgi:hypothetical protein